ncbi:uncharacterized protein LOC142504950 [Primulina tabacum]|uniref:uncharacterized protein LOC142504950 n=1 Tax=Primulina tabacum TaxID=48773 RepID=UPI003F5929C8
MELVIARFQDMRPPKFFGNEGGEKATAWLKSMNYLFNLVEYTPELRLKLAVYQLKDRAQLWWEATEEAIRESGQIISWEVIRTHFIQEYSPPSYYSAKEAEFNQLVQGNMSVGEYASQFSALLAYVPHVSNSDRSKLSRFMQGLNRTIHTLVMTGAPTTYAEAVEKAKNIEANTGASHSFLSAAFIDEHEIATTLLLDTVSVSTPAGVYLMSNQIVLNCVIRFDDNLMITNLIKLSMSDFDSILGMDTLSNYRATVDCFHGVVRFRPYFGDKRNFYGNDSQSRIPLVSAMEIFRLLSAGNEGFMIYAVDVTQEEMLKVSDIPVVKDFPDVFPDEIPGFPPQREIDFSIELMSGTNQISRAPYRLALAELKELKEQLRDLLEKGYIRPKLNKWQRRLLEFVKDYDCDICYHSERANVIVDALSRKTKIITQLSLQRPLQSEIQRFELTMYARGKAPNLTTMLLQSNFRDIICGGQSSDEQLQKWRVRNAAKFRKLYSEVNVFPISRSTLDSYW